jgi:hypothetical protein
MIGIFGMLANPEMLSSKLGRAVTLLASPPQAPRPENRAGYNEACAETYGSVVRPGAIRTGDPVTLR